MSVEEDGGTPEPKTYSEEEMATAIEGAKKAGATDSHSHWQSIADKAIATAKADGTARESELTNTIETMRTAHIESLPESERQSAMIEELYKDRHEEKPSGPAPESKTIIEEPAFDEPKYAKDMQDQIGVVLKDLGLDPSKINWGDGKDSQETLKTFLTDVVEQAQGQSKEDPDVDDDKPRGDNKVDMSRGAGNVSDIYTVDPKELVSQDKWEPIRGMIEG